MEDIGDVYFYEDEELLTATGYNGKIRTKCNKNSVIGLNELVTISEESDVNTQENDIVHLKNHYECILVDVDKCAQPITPL